MCGWGAEQTLALLKKSPMAFELRYPLLLTSHAEQRTGFTVAVCSGR
jgi:hypothetical protein